jgi:hypothetical protein
MAQAKWLEETFAKRVDLAKSLDEEQRRAAEEAMTRQAIKGNKGIAVRPTFQPEDKFVTIGSIRFLSPIKPRFHSSSTFPRIRLDAEQPLIRPGVEPDLQTIMVRTLLATQGTLY